MTFTACCGTRPTRRSKGSIASLTGSPCLTLTEPEELKIEEQRADTLRHDMEDRLMEAFTTPFDRQDIYQISRQMDYILNNCLSTAQEMNAFEVPPDDAIRKMAYALRNGVEKWPKPFTSWKGTISPRRT